MLDSTIVPLFLVDGLGPCRASVRIDALRLSSGRVRFVVAETWTPKDADHAGEISWTTMHDDELEARAHAFDASLEWSRGSARADLLAPGGRLRRGDTIEW